MSIFQKLSELQIKLEKGCNGVVQRVFPSMREGTLRWVWMVLYGLLCLGSLGALILTLMGIGGLTAIGCIHVQENYFPGVSTESLHTSQHVGQRVSFIVSELSSNECFPLSNGLRIPAIRLGSEVASQIQAGDIRLRCKEGVIVSCLSAEESSSRLEQLLRQQGLEGEELSNVVQENYFSFLPSHISGKMLVMGQLLAPGDVLVKRVENDVDDFRIVGWFSEDLWGFGGFFLFVSLCALVGTWGVFWSARSVIRHHKRGEYRPTVGLCMTALLHGGSLIVAAFMLGYAVYELFLTEMVSDFAPLNFLPELQIAVSVTVILLFQMCWFRLREARLAETAP